MSSADIANIIQGAALVGVVTAALVGLRQLSTMHHGGSGANYFPLWDRLQSDDARKNRQLLFAAADQFGAFTPTTWDETAKEAAGHVCQVWSFAGRMAMEDVVPKRFVIDEWGPLIVRCWTMAQPVIAFERTRRGNAELYSSFRWLAIECGVTPQF